MAQQEIDPLRAWQDLVQKWEIEVNEWSGKLTGNDQFSALMGQATKMNLVAQKAWAERMETMLEALNLPSKSQIEGLAERLDRIEDNIERMRLSIEQAAEKPAKPAKPEPKRTRKPPRKKG